MEYVYVVSARSAHKPWSCEYWVYDDRPRVCEVVETLKSHLLSKTGSLPDSVYIYKTNGDELELCEYDDDAFIPDECHIKLMAKMGKRKIAMINIVNCRKVQVQVSRFIEM